MTTAPDVLYLRGDRFYDAPATAWDASNLRPLVPEVVATPLAHRDDCFVAPWPPLAVCCAYTESQQYARRRVAWEVS
jgi:hypothetical protein